MAAQCDCNGSTCYRTAAKSYGDCRVCGWGRDAGGVTRARLCSVCMFDDLLRVKLVFPEQWGPCLAAGCLAQVQEHRTRRGDSRRMMAQLLDDTMALHPRAAGGGPHADPNDGTIRDGQADASRGERTPAPPSSQGFRHEGPPAAYGLATGEMTAWRMEAEDARAALSRAPSGDWPLAAPASGATARQTDQRTTRHCTERGEPNQEPPGAFPTTWPSSAGAAQREWSMRPATSDLGAWGGAASSSGHPRAPPPSTPPPPTTASKQTHVLVLPLPHPFVRPGPPPVDAETQRRWATAPPQLTVHAQPQLPMMADYGWRPTVPHLSIDFSSEQQLVSAMVRMTSARMMVQNATDARPDLELHMNMQPRSQAAGQGHQRTDTPAVLDWHWV